MITLAHDNLPSRVTHSQRRKNMQTTSAGIVIGLAHIPRNVYGMSRDELTQQHALLAKPRPRIAITADWLVVAGSLIF